jgi:hypothetical protein
MSLPKLNPVEPPWYGPVCPVVGEGWHREVSPYPDPQPVAELLARRLGGREKRDLDIGRFQIVDRETQCQRRRHLCARALRGLPAQPAGRVTTCLADREPAEPDDRSLPLLGSASICGVDPLALVLQRSGEPRCRGAIEVGFGEGWSPGRVGPFPRIVFGEILDDHGTALAFEQAQCRENHALLERRVARRTERAAQLERNPQRTGRLGVFGLRPNEADRHSRDALFLEIMPQRAHGARAERSNGRERNGADPVGVQPRRDVTRVGFHLHRIGRAHEGIMGRRHRSDYALGGELAQAVEREHDVPVFLKAAAVEIEMWLNISCPGRVSDGITR